VNADGSTVVHTPLRGHEGVVSILRGYQEVLGVIDDDEHVIGKRLLTRGALHELNQNG